MYAPVIMLAIYTLAQKSRVYIHYLPLSSICGKGEIVNVDKS